MIFNVPKLQILTFIVINSFPAPQTSRTFLTQLEYIFHYPHVSDEVIRRK